MYITFASLQMADIPLGEDILDEEAEWAQQASLQEEQALLNLESEPAPVASSTAVKPLEKLAFPVRKSHERDASEDYYNCLLVKFPG